MYTINPKLITKNKAKKQEQKENKKQIHETKGNYKEYSI